MKSDRNLARALGQISSDAAFRTRAIRRAKVIEFVDGRYVVDYRGQQITVGSSWPGRLVDGAWVDVVDSSGLLEISGPSGYAGG